MGEFASKGATYGIGIPALVAGGLALLNQNNGCGNGVLGNILGGNSQCYETKESAILRQENAILKSENSTDKKILDVYVAGQNELKERDSVIRDLTIAATQNACKVDNIDQKVTRLQEITEVQNTELADSRVREAELNGRVNTLAVSTKDKFEAFANEFNTALGCEINSRKAADEAIYGWTDCNFVRNVKKVDASQICPLPVTSQDVVNYYLAGNTSATPAATGGTCCASGSTRTSSLDKK